MAPGQTALHGRDLRRPTLACKAPAGTMPPRILTLHCSVPPKEFLQGEVYRTFFADRFRKNSKAREIFENSRIEKRHAVVDAGFFARERTIEDRNHEYVRGALDLGESAIRRCLEEIPATPRELDDFIVVSCTGYSNPGLEILLAKRLGMRQDLRRTAIGGMGCYAAFPGMARAYESLITRPDARVLLLAVEICSVTLQDDASTENVVASALFGDGAAALILGDGRLPASAGPPLFPRVVGFETHTSYKTTGEMGFFVTATGFAIQLSARIPVFLRQNVAGVVERLLAGRNLKLEDIRFWVIHPGGAKILDYVQEVFGLSEEDMRYSRGILSEFGNMSSPTVMFILDRIIRRGDPQPGDYGLMMGFGPGLTIETCLLQW